MVGCEQWKLHPRWHRWIHLGCRQGLTLVQTKPQSSQGYNWSAARRGLWRVDPLIPASIDANGLCPSLRNQAFQRRDGWLKPDGMLLIGRHDGSLLRIDIPYADHLNGTGQWRLHRSGGRTELATPAMDRLVKLHAHLFHWPIRRRFNIVDAYRSTLMTAGLDKEMRR